MSTNGTESTARLVAGLEKLSKLQAMEEQLPTRLAEARTEVIDVLADFGIAAKIAPRRAQAKPRAAARPAGEGAANTAAVRACLPASVSAIVEQTGLPPKTVGVLIAGMLRWGKVEKVEDTDPVLYRLVDDQAGVEA